MKKNRPVKFLFIGLIIFVFAGCAQVTRTKLEAFPRVYKNKPLTILVLPPINESTAADAKEYFSCSINEPLSNTGYYVIPVESSHEILKNEGLYDTELITPDLLNEFKEYFGADAVLFTKIKEWDTSYYVIGGNVTVSVDYLLRSTQDGRKLWGYSGKLVVDTTDRTDTGGGWVGLLINIAATAVKTAATDYFPIAQKVNNMVFETLPVGKYNVRFLSDQKDHVKLKSDYVAEEFYVDIEENDLEVPVDYRNPDLDYVLLKDNTMLIGRIVDFKDNKLYLESETVLTIINMSLIDSIRDHLNNDITESRLNRTDYKYINYNNYLEIKKLN